MQQIITENEWLWTNENDVLETMEAKDDNMQQTKEERSIELSSVNSNIELVKRKQHKYLYDTSNNSS